MKTRASKRLLKAIICFVVSVVFCVGVCLAWFAISEKVDSNGAGVSVEEGDVVNFEVDVYYLDNAPGSRVDGTYTKAATGNVTAGIERYEVDNGEDGALESELDSMRPYGALGGTFATAVLFDIKYEIRPTDKKYRIMASCEDTSMDVTRVEDEVDSFISKLSNVVGYYSAAADGSNYIIQRNKPQSFVDAQFVKKLSLELQGDITSDGAENLVGETFFIMDYIEEPFIQLSSDMVKAGGSLYSRLLFDGDITITLETVSAE